MQYQYSFRKLIAWQRAKDLTLYIYRVTKAFPKEELYALSSQLKRASYSVMANIAEGNNRPSVKEKCRFFDIALASLTEVDCLLELARDLTFLSPQEYIDGLERINKTAFLLRKLISSQSSQNSQNS